MRDDELPNDLTHDQRQRLLALPPEMRLSALRVLRNLQYGDYKRSDVADLRDDDSERRHP